MLTISLTTKMNSKMVEEGIMLILRTYVAMKTLPQ